MLALLLAAMTAAYSATVPVDVTYYVDVGEMASQQPTFLGAAACSDRWDFGTVIVFADGRTVTCLDRGRGGASWVDVWVPSLSYGQNEIANVYGMRTIVTVITPDY